MKNQHQRPASRPTPKNRTRRDRFRRLFAELLERRVLLTTVTAVTPAANSHNAPNSTDIDVAFDQPIEAATATLETIAIHAAQHGRLSAADGLVAVDGSSVNIDPTANFFAGEIITGTVTAGVQSTDATATTPHVWQFRTAVAGGGAVFTDDGGFGNSTSTAVALGDVDADGDLDAFIANRDTGNRVWMNVDNNFVDSGQSLGNHASFGVALGDLDSDGDLDAFVANAGQVNRIWLNDQGTFTDSGQLLGFRENSLDVALGDVDGDGDLDAVVANNLQGDGVWLNNGGVFSLSQTIGLGSSNDIELGDLDNDGDLDAFVANFYQPNRILINEDGRFSDSGQNLGNHASRAVALGDIDGDGDVDGFVGNGSQPNRLWINDGGVFTDSGQAIGSESSYAVALGDLDADGDLDVVSGNTNAGAGVWLNDEGILREGGQRLSPAYTLGVAAGDVDADGDLDFVTANDGANSVWLNENPTLSLSPTKAIVVEGNSETSAISFTVSRLFDTRGAAAVDFIVTGSGDDPAEADDFLGGTLPAGTLEFADGTAAMTFTVEVVGDTVEENDEGFIVTLQNPVGSNIVIGHGVANSIIRNDDNVDLGDLPGPFATLLSDNGPAHILAGPILGAARDGEDDGQPSPAADGDDSNGAPADEDGVTNLTGVIPGTNTAGVTITATAAGLLDAWIDFNADGSFGGAAEQVFSSQPVAAGENALTFAVPAAATPGDRFARFRLSTAGGLGPTGGAADGEVEDLLVQVVAPIGSGVFSDTRQPIGNGSSLDVALGDVDGDGDLDAFVANTDREGDRVWINANGVFTDSGQTLGNHNSTAVALGDLDNDGDLDAFVATDADNFVWINEAGTFTDSGQRLGAADSRGVALGDVDSDGDLDAFVANAGGANRVWVNDGGVFGDTGQLLGNHNTHDVALGDLDGDGDLDAFSSNYGEPNRVWINQDGSFNDSGQSVGDSLSQSAALGDLDGDGDLDAFVANTDQGNQIWLNEGGAFTDGGSAPGGHFSFDVALGDLDGDGDLDAFVANAEPDNVLVSGAGNRVLLNEAGSFADVGQPIGNHASFGVGLGDLDSDGDLDAFVANYKLPTSAAPIPGEANRVWLNLHDQWLVSIEATDATKPEGDTDTTTFDFEVARVGNASSAADVTFVVAGITADAGDFGGTLPAGVVSFAAGERSQQLSISVTGDTDVELNEEFAVTIAARDAAGILVDSALGIIENDDITPLTLFLTADGDQLVEDEGIVNLTASLPAAATEDVLVDLGISGTATAGEDYVVSATQIVIEEGSTSGEVTLTAVDDDVEEEDETIIVEITNASLPIGVGRQTITISDDDGPRPLQVAAFVVEHSGFQVRFSDRVDLNSLNVFDSQSAELGAADVTLTGTASGPVEGSLVADPGGTSFHFIRAGGPLIADSYSLVLHSGEDGWKSHDGELLDGDADGIAGGDFVTSFLLTPPPADAQTVSVPDFVRGPGQPVNLPANSTGGLPLGISGDGGATTISLQVAFDPDRLQVISARVSEDMPEGSSVDLQVINNTATQGIAVIDFRSGAPLPAGSHTFVHLETSVPTADANDIYGSQQKIDLRAIEVFDPIRDLLPVVDDDGVHVVSFFGDVTANGRINPSDASQLARVAVGVDTGFVGQPLAPAILTADITGNGRINAVDASRVAQFAAAVPVDEIPPLPEGVVIGAGSNAPSVSGLELLVAGVGADESQAQVDVGVGNDSVNTRAPELLSAAHLTDIAFGIETESAEFAEQKSLLEPDASDALLDAIDAWFAEFGG